MSDLMEMKIKPSPKPGKNSLKNTQPSQLMSQTSINTTRHMKKTYSKTLKLESGQRVRELLLSFWGILGLTLAIISEEVAWDMDLGVVHYGRKVQYFQMAVSISTVVLLLSLIEYYIFLTQISLRKMKISSGLRFWEVHDLRYAFLLEFLYLSIHPVPGFSYINPSSHGTNVAYGVLTLVMFFRIYLPARAVVHFYPFWKNRRLLGKRRQEVSFNWLFIIKEMFYNYPVLVTLGLWVIIMFICAYSLYIAERSIQPLVFGRFRNAIWNVMITASTVGYGDTFPTSNWGRSVSSFTCWMGIVIGSILTVATITQMTLSTTEKRAVDAFGLLEEKKKLEIVAVTILQTSYRRERWRRKVAPSLRDAQRQAGEETWGKKLGFLYFDLRKFQREVALMRAKLGEDAEVGEILARVRRMEKRLDELPFAHKCEKNSRVRKVFSDTVVSTKTPERDYSHSD